MAEILVNIDGITKDMLSVIQNAASFALKKTGVCGIVSVAVVGDDEMRELNKNFRHIDSATDVLSFPSFEGDAIATAMDNCLGDIIISFDRARYQADEYGHSIERELAFLTIHGVLHLTGYDHTEPEEAKIMEQMQKEILSEMGISR